MGVRMRKKRGVNDRGRRMVSNGKGGREEKKEEKT